MDLEDIAMQLSAVDNNDLKQVAGLVRQQLLLEQRVEDLKAEVVKLREEYHKMVSGDA